VGVDLTETVSDRLTRVVVADDHEPTRFLLRTLLEFVPTIEIVGEAATGKDAVALVLEHQADIALLDVEMPVMDGFTAAELIRSNRPSTRIILHTAYADRIKYARAEALGLTLLVKQGFEETVAAVAERFDSLKKGAEGAVAVEGLVLSALAAQGTDAMIVVRDGGTIPYYTTGAAELFDLPVPAVPTTLEALLDAHPLVDRLGEPLAEARNPLSKALGEHVRDEGELAESLPNGSIRTYWVRAQPIFDLSGTFLGVASFLNVLAETPRAVDPTDVPAPGL
jgi:two-component system, NarL family, response regulator DesR